jgi:BirA family biotin operon repressor/biotin-[acetyl-CoA-carboxylase] ligase
MSLEPELTREALEERLGGCPFGTPLYVYHTVESTNTVLQALAEDGAPQGTVVLADEQTAGRGRLGRRWYSPSGGLWFSTLLRPEAEPNAGWAATVCASLGVLRGILTATRQAVHPHIMWPNDMVVGGKKISGILADAKAREDGRLQVIVGVGVNVNIVPEDFPADVRERATSLLAFLGRPISRAELLESILRGFAEAYAVYGRHGITALLQPWRVHSATIGKAVRVSLADRVLEGTAVDVTESGALVIRSSGGTTEQVVAGDVMLVRTGG